MPEFILDYQEYLIFGIAYFTFCAIAKRFIEYFIELKEKTINSQKELREKFESEYKENAKKPWEKYKSNASSLGKERSYYFTMLGLSIILVIVNAFILAQFLDSIGNLKSPIMIEPMRINYSHLIAASIVIIEIATGIVYYLGYMNQQKDEENTIWAMLKYFSLIAFFSLMLVETIMWSKLSVKFDMPVALGLSENNAFRDYIDYFLGALGIGFTLAEFAMGFYISKYSEHGKASPFTNFLRYAIYSILDIILYLIPSIILLVTYYASNVLIFVIKLIAIPGDALLEKIGIN